MLHITNCEVRGGWCGVGSEVVIGVGGGGRLVSARAPVVIMCPLTRPCSKLIPILPILSLLLLLLVGRVVRWV